MDTDLHGRGIYAGYTDLYSPLLHLTGDAGLQLRLEEYTGYVTTGANFVAISGDGPAGILRPGESGRLPVYDLAQGGNNTIRVGYALETPTDPMDWDLLKVAVRPSYASASWDEMWDQQIVTYGDTMGDYVHLVSDAANLYWTREGKRTHREGVSLSYLTQDNMMTWFSNLSGRVYLDSTLYPTGGIDVIAYDAIAVNLDRLVIGQDTVRVVDHDPIVARTHGHQKLIEVGHVKAEIGSAAVGQVVDFHGARVRRTEAQHDVIVQRGSGDGQHAIGDRGVKRGTGGQ